MGNLNTLGLAHYFLQSKVPVGGVCIDATAGRGRDTVFLCNLVGEQGKVFAFDIQQSAIESTQDLLQSKGYDQIATVIKDSHANMAQYVPAESVDAIVFNFGYLPSGDHAIFTQPTSSIQAIEQGLQLLKPHAVMCLCIYYGGDTGYEERDALLAHLETIDPKQYTVLTCDWKNRPNDPPIVALIFKDT